MRTFRERAIKYLQERFPRAVVSDRVVQLLEQSTGTVVKPIHLLVAYDTDAAIKQSLIAVPHLGAHGEISHVVSEFPQLLIDLKASIGIRGGNVLTGHLVGSERMLDSPRLIIYTDALHCARSEVMDAFGKAGHLIDLIHESEMHGSVFSS